MQNAYKACSTIYTTNTKTKAGKRHENRNDIRHNSSQKQLLYGRACKRSPLHCEKQRDEKVRAFFYQAMYIYKNRNISTPFRLIVYVYYPDYTHDLDNSLKGLLDNLQYCGAISNDNLCVEIVARRHYDRYKPRVQFCIEELNEQKQLFY